MLSEFVHFEQTKSTAYNTLESSDNDGIICYDRTSSSGAIPGKPSCGPPGNRDKDDHVFCMRFSVVGTQKRGIKTLMVYNFS